MNCYFNCKAFVAVILMCCHCSFAARAQEQAPSVMTLHDCMEYAVSNSTKMRIAEADRKDEQALRRQAIDYLWNLFHFSVAKIHNLRLFSRHSGRMEKSEG